MGFILSDLKEYEFKATDPADEQIAEHLTALVRRSVEREIAEVAAEAVTAERERCAGIVRGLATYFEQRVGEEFVRAREEALAALREILDHEGNTSPSTTSSED